MVAMAAVLGGVRRGPGVASLPSGRPALPPRRRVERLVPEPLAGRVPVQLRPREVPRPLPGVLRGSLRDPAGPGGYGPAAAHRSPLGGDGAAAPPLATPAGCGRSDGG